MPEATINLHNDPSAREHDVRTARQTSQIHPIAQTTPMKFSADGKLGLGASGPLPGHERGHLETGCRGPITGTTLRGHEYKHDPPDDRHENQAANLWCEWERLTPPSGSL